MGGATVDLFEEFVEILAALKVFGDRLFAVSVVDIPFPGTRAVITGDDVESGHG